MNQFMARYDLLLTPTMPMTAFAVNENGAWGGTASTSAGRRSR